MDNDITYFGVININIDERTIGSVDVWRSATTKQLYCEEKQLGIESLADTVGMPEIKQDEKWGIVVSKLQKGKDKWKLVKLPENGKLKFETIDEQVLDLDIENYKIKDSNHWSFLVENNVNKAVEITQEIES